MSLAVTQVIGVGDVCNAKDGDICQINTNYVDVSFLRELTVNTVNKSNSKFLFEHHVFQIQINVHQSVSRQHVTVVRPSVPSLTSVLTSE